MQRKSTGKLILTAILYTLFANILCAIMTISFAPFLSADIAQFMRIVIAIFTTIVFFSMAFTVAYKDGQYESSLVKNGREKTPMDRWLSIGFIMSAFAALPTIILLILMYVAPSNDYLLIYRFISGSAFPFIMIFNTAGLMQTMSPILPIALIAFYMLIPLATKLGFDVGYTGKFDKDKIMYK